ncbi:3-ketoacyl-CoA thiolase, peroxisomal [Clydaea vesicula]|uniref:acetyl-CoA C-acyltransferase n=1 Tax=Clydaea vesicula TaxID=447962 RepID=A0AAD5U2L6_9FUNG|nr:3-ketoacyl-CoA thiolase, peroxisomal [Clydaea vesicula]KAJ3379708.1 3-ketoacyl-CoA thiolase, peroxisomal [Lobulomyces angularis]
MSNRVNQVAGHLAAHHQVGQKHPDDVVIVSALRTPMTRGKRGGFKDTHPEFLLAAVLKATVERTGIDPALIDDIQVGNVLPASGGATQARMAQLYAGFPETSSISTVNRQCSSGLQAVHYIASAIQNGTIDIGIGAGVESMTLSYGPSAMPPSYDDDISAFPAAADCLLPMGITSENVAKKFGVSREKQDSFSALSHKKAANAWKNGWFNEEVIPVTVTQVDKEGNEKKVTVKADDGIRPETTPESLAKLKPAFSKDGFTTAGNASQVSDGAAAVLLMKRSTAKKLNLPILGKFTAFATAGVPPNIMGVGPAYAIPKVLKKVGLNINQVDIYEINEAFASQAVYSVEKLGIDINKVNPKGGAIAMGHPLGATGARQVATLLTELRRTGKKIGVISMCIGSGMGAAAVLEAE